MRGLVDLLGWNLRDALLLLQATLCYVIVLVIAVTLLRWGW